MNAMSRLARAALWCVGSLCAAAAVAAQSSPSGNPSNVTVRYADPQNFSESRDAAYGSSSDADYLAQLQRHVERRAAGLLQPGERLAITMTDIELREAAAR